MPGSSKTKARLIDELEAAHARIEELERAERARQRPDQALRESEARYHNLFERVPVGLYRSTPAGRILAANPALVQMLGYPDLESLVNTDAASLYAQSDDRQKLLREIDRGGVAIDLEFQLRRRDGTRIWVRENVRAVCDDTGDVVCYEGSLEDITERKRAQEALRKERDFSTSLLQASPTFFVAISAEGRTLMMNEAMLTTLGYSQEEAVGTNYLETFVPESDRRAAANVFEKLVHLRKPTLNENRVLTKDGQELLVEWHGRPVFKEDGQFDFFFGVGIDITQRRRAEEEKARVEAQLRHAHKMQAVGRLAAGVAHDFNNILAVILGNAEYALRKSKDEPADSPVTYALQQIVESVERGMGLVKRLLTFGGARPGKPQLLDLNRVVADMEKMLRPLIGHRIELKVVAAPELKPVRADPGQIEEAVLNLLLNARDAMLDGGRVTVETTDVVLDEAQAAAHIDAKPGPRVMLSVSDTGVGMDAETRQRLFEPFFTTKPADKGTGLGLSIVHGIVTQTGGHIEVDSQPGKGATFRLFFPAAE